MTQDGRTEQRRGGFSGWIDAVLFDLARQMRWSFLPPLMVYFAAGFSGLTGIVGTFYVKEYLDLSAAYLAGLAFWAGLPWALKMPLGHLVDIIWRWKWLLVYLGAGLIGLSMIIMYLVITQTAMMATVMPPSAWFIASFLLTPCGLVLQDAVADAMSVEAVPRVDAEGAPIADEASRAMHTTMQTLGRFALISGTVAVAAMNIWMFRGIEAMDDAAKADIYARIYLVALLIPLLSVSGVMLAGVQRYRARHRMLGRGLTPDETDALFEGPDEKTEPNPWYFIGGGAFVALTLAVGLGQVPYGQEIVFAGSMAIVLLLMRQLIAVLAPAQARALIGTATIIFVFRAVPRPGNGQTWFEIDVLGSRPAIPVGPVADHIGADAGGAGGAAPADGVAFDRVDLRHADTGRGAAEPAQSRALLRDPGYHRAADRRDRGCPLHRGAGYGGGIAAGAGLDDPDAGLDRAQCAR